MSWAPIKKSSEPWCVQPHLLDYEKACADFTWDEIRHELDGLPGGLGLNIAHEMVDRHTNGPRRDQSAIRWLGQDGTVLDLTYADLKEQMNRFANVLATLGVDKGDRVFTLAGRIPELYITAIGAWKRVSVFCQLFSAFGPEPIYQRLRKGDAKVLVTTKRLYRQKVAELRERLPQLTHLLLTDAEKDLSDGVWSLHQCMAQASGKFVIPPTDPEEMAILHFTRGTTGMPKGAVHVHDDPRYKNCFRGGWYITGDMARRDADGYFWFVGCTDDIIKTSGHMVGPFEVESALMEHPAVAEAGVIGKPHPLIGDLVKAFVSLQSDSVPSDKLRLELIGFARKKLGSTVAPKEIAFQDSLPKNKAGKIMRRLLKGCELGMAEGDTSTLDTNSD